MSKGFKPMRGTIALKKDGQKGETDAGIIYTEKENPRVGTGIVASCGLDDILPNGKPLKPSFKEGDRVMYSKTDGYHEVGGFVILKFDAVIAVLDKDVEIK